MQAVSITEYMKKKILIAGLFIAVAMGLMAVYMYRKGPELVVTGRPVYSMSAAELFAEYENDEQAADARYLNKVIAVRGKVADVAESDTSGVNVILAAQDPMFGISCSFREKPDKLSVGDEVTVNGLCSGKLMDVLLIRCVIEKK